MDGMGVNITIMSYRGVLYWGIIACPETIPRVWNLTAAIPVALDELLAAAGEAPAAYRSEDAGAAVRASGIEVEHPRPERIGHVARADVRGSCPGQGAGRHGHRRGARAHRDGPAEGLGGGLERGSPRRTRRR